MMFKGALRSDQEWEAFHNLIETLGDEDVDYATEAARSSRRLLKEAPVQQDQTARRSSRAPEAHTEQKGRIAELKGRSDRSVATGSAPEKRSSPPSQQGGSERFDGTGRLPGSVAKREEAAPNLSSQTQDSEQKHGCSDVA